MMRKSTKNLLREEWLTAHFGRLEGGEPNLLFAGPARSDMRLLHEAFCGKGRDERGAPSQPSLVEELEARGYDVATIEFRARKARPAGAA